MRYELYNPEVTILTSGLYNP